jgi:hypothetical protein
MNDIRIVLADDHPVVRAGLAALLGSMSGIEVVGVAADGREAVRGRAATSERGRAGPANARPGRIRSHARDTGRPLKSPFWC